MAAVAVWGHKPGAQELLDARLARGWQPTSTTLRTGKRVLGYAACLFDDALREVRDDPGLAALRDSPAWVSNED